MTDGFDDTTRYFHWDFNPYLPIRPDNFGENIFMRRWQKLVCRGTAEENKGGKMKIDAYFVENCPEEFPILRILGPLGYPSERDTKVATSVIRWLGAPVGLSFIDECKRKMPRRRNPVFNREDIYLAAWSIENAPKFRNTGTARSFIAGREQPLTVYDSMVMDRVMLWIGSEDGQKFLNAAMRDVKKVRDADMHRIRSGQAKLFPGLDF